MAQRRIVAVFGSSRQGNRVLCQGLGLSEWCIQPMHLDQDLLDQDPLDQDILDQDLLDMEIPSVVGAALEDWNDNFAVTSNRLHNVEEQVAAICDCAANDGHDAQVQVLFCCRHNQAEISPQTANLLYNMPQNVTMLRFRPIGPNNGYNSTWQVVLSTHRPEINNAVVDSPAGLYDLLLAQAENA